jgi:dipeptidyl aminopeptidase/acylaminoacyl peptidase
MTYKVSVAMLLATATVLFPARTPAQGVDSAYREQMFERYLDLPSYVQGGVVDPHWLRDGSSMWFVEQTSDGTQIYTVTAGSTTKAPLVQVDRLKAALAKMLGHEVGSRGLPFDTVRFSDDESSIRFVVEGKAFDLRLQDYSLRRASAPSEEEKQRAQPQVVTKPFHSGDAPILEVLTPDGQWFASLVDYNLAIRSAYDGRLKTFTTDGKKDHSWVLDGAQWSPDGYTLATRKIDSSRVGFIPIVHWLKPEEEVEWAHYSRSGGPLPQQEMYLVGRVSEQAVRVDVGNGEDSQLTLASWLPDGSEVLLYKANRANSQIDLLATNAATGATRVILTERSDTFLQMGYTANPSATLVKSTKQFIWTSQRDGWNHLYLYDLSGRLIRGLTHGQFVVLQVLSVDDASGWVYFTAHGNSQRPYDTHLYRVGLDGHGFTRLTEGDGQHNIKMAPSNKFFADTHSSIDRPPRTELRNSSGGLLQVLSIANVDRLSELHWSAPEAFVAKAADGHTDLYGVMYKPFDFDAGRKYPIIEVIYGGPQISVVQKEFVYEIPYSVGAAAQALAQLGFVVWIVDARGTTDRGKQFQDLVYLNWGRNEIPDHVAVLKQLVSRYPFMDGDRTGLFGASWGGYMTVRGMVMAPDVYKVGVAEWPVVDLYDHWAEAIEPYMGLPQHHPAAYEYASSTRLAGQLRGKLLLVHGTSDVNAPFSSTIQMVEALTRAGKPYDLIVLPEQAHKLYGVSRTYALHRVAQYFIDNLKP